MRSLGITLTLAFGAAGLLPAQEFRGTIAGQVRDGSGAAIVGATIRAIQRSTNQATGATTNQDGFYVLPYLQPSDYDVEVSANGFRKMKKENVALLVAQKLDLDFKLEVGQMNQEITVQAEVEVLQTADASGGMNFDSRMTSEYALNGRQLYMMMDLSPGVLFTQEEFGATGYSGTRGWDVNGNFTMNGSKTGTTAFALNGSPISLTGTFNISPNVDAVQEFKVMTNTWDAAIGRSGGGAVNTSIKAGTNSFHFTAGEFIRNRVFDANTTQLNAAGQPRGKHNVNQISLTAGGPIRKNKDFIFGSIEIWRERVPFSVVADVPTLDLRNGQGFSAVPSNIFDPLTSHPCVAKVDVSSCNSTYIRDPFPGNVIPQNRMSPIGTKILSYFPAPNYPGPVNNYIADTGGIYRYDQPIVRWDHVFDDFNRLNVLTSYQWGQEFRNSTGIPGPGASGNIWTRRQPISVSANFTHFSHLYIFDVRFSFSRFSQTFPNIDKNGELTAQGLGITGITRANSSPFNSPPRITLDQYSNLFGNGSNLQTYKAENQWNIAPSVTLPRSTMTYKFGADLVYAGVASGDTGYANGYLNFNRWGSWQYSSRTSALNAADGNSIADILLGIPYSGQVDAYDSFYRSWPYFGIFMQTDWKVRRNLTLNLGLRYDVQIPWVERFDRNNTGFDFNAVSPYNDAVIAQWKAYKAEYDATNPRYPYPDVPAAILGGKTFVDPNKDRRTYDTDWTNIQPRVGLAWALAPKTVLRTGFGMYHRTATQTGLTDGFNQTTTYNRSLDGDRFPSSYPNGVFSLTGPYSLANPFPYGVEAPGGASLGLLANAGNAVSFDPRQRPIPRTFQYSFGFQRQIFWSAKLEANYVGSITNHDSMTINVGRWPYEINQLGYATSAFGTTTVKNPFYGIVPAIRTRGSSPTMQRMELFRTYPLFADVTNNIIPKARYRYDALQLRVDKRFSGDRAAFGGLTLVFSYTFSKNMQSANYLNNWNYLHEQPVHELVSYDKPQNIAVSGVWGLPFGRGRYFLKHTNKVVSGVAGGWTLNWSYRFTSGNPVAGINAVNKCGTLLVDEQTHDRQWNNTSSCWAGNPSYMPRVVEDRYAWLRQMDNVTTNLAAAKEFSVSERLKLQLRGEAFNLLNHVIYKPANTTYNNADFGKLSIEQQNFPRQIQLSAKIRF
jgi:hypothetical protein